MAWSRAQQLLFFRAATSAGWNDAQRYIAMRHAGCPLMPGKGGDRRPSAKHPRNDNEHFESVMALAESCARARGAGSSMPTRAHGRDWSEPDVRRRDRLARKAREIWSELSERVPDVFQGTGLDGFAARVCMNDDASLTMRLPPRALDECDAGQLRRIVEALRGWGGRECLRRGLGPRTFTIPPSSRRQLEREHQRAVNAC